MIRAIALVAFVAVAACAGRPLTEAERAFAGSIMEDEVDFSSVRVVEGSASGLFSATVNPRPRTTCRERLFPPLDEPFTGTFPVFVLEDTLYYTREIYRPDFLDGYPEQMTLTSAMLLAHELTHVWQWQNRAETGYSPFSALNEHVVTDDPYLIEIDPQRAFLDYGWEQQGILMEEFVCCRALDPEGRRTTELARVISEVFPAALGDEAVPVGNISLPWDGAETGGICS